jgi:hypothetical protein
MRVARTMAVQVPLRRLAQRSTKALSRLSSLLASESLSGQSCTCTPEPRLRAWQTAAATKEATSAPGTVFEDLTAKQEIGNLPEQLDLPRLSRLFSGISLETA